MSKTTIVSVFVSEQTHNNMSLIDVILNRRGLNVKCTGLEDFDPNQTQEQLTKLFEIWAEDACVNEGMYSCKFV